MAKKIVVASGKGGVGKSSVSVGLAKALTQKGKSVLIVDCDSLCSIDILLKADERIVYNWGDVILKRCSLEDAIYKAQDISLMTCPKSYEGVTFDSMKELADLLDGKFDYIFFDAPAGIDLGFMVASFVADRGLVISTPDLLCVRSACAAAREMNKYNISNIRLIINRVVKKELKQKKILDIDSVIDKTEVQLIGIIPEDTKILHATMDGSIFKKGQISYKAFCNIASRIEGDYVRL